MQNYHKHSYVSNIILADSVVSNEDYCKRAVELGHKIISSCEHGTQGDWFGCHDLAKQYGLKWRYVSEAYFVKDRNPELGDKNNCHIILAAKTKKGIGDINEALSEANISGYYFRPRVDMEILMGLDPKDVFVTTACLGGVWRYGFVKHDDAEYREVELDGGGKDKILSKEATWHYDFTEPDKIVHQLHAHFGDSFMLEIQYHDVEKQKVINRHILDLYRKYGIKMIVGLDSHFILPEEEALRAQRLEANHITYENEDGFFMDYPSDDETFARFMHQGVFSPAQIRDAMDNTDIFLTFEDVELDKSKKLPSLDLDLTQEQRNEKYRQLIRTQWKQYRDTVPEEQWADYLEGVKYEVDTITETNMSDYFLLSNRFVDHYIKSGGSITKTGRGSAPSYFTNMLIGLSSIDRFKIPVTMYPDRFISKDRLLSGNLPDIDNNVGDQALAAKCLADIMGEWHSAPMVAFGTLKRLSAWKMYCRAAAVPFEEANEVSDMLKQYDLDVKHADEDDKDTINVFEYVPEKYWEQLKMSEKFLGMIDNISPHPCAYLICNQDIRREIGIYRINSKTGKKKVVYAAFVDGATAEANGYLKLDLLAVDVVKVNADIYKRIGIPQPSVPELMELIDGDKETWNMYAKGYTLGLNQAEKEKSTEKVMRYKPKNLSELSAFVAGIRPAFQSKINDLLDRRHFDYGIPALDDLLQTPEMTSSFILYQEQMMKVLQYAGFSAPESYSSIKAIAKKHPEKVLPLKARFLEGFSAKLIEDGTAESVAHETSEQVWTIISDACGYGFNSSHSVSVALDSLYTAYAKAHYPYETYVALMTNYAEKGDKERIDRAKQEMKKAFGITTAPCRFRQDNRDFFLDKERKTISDTLMSVKHISKRVADELYRMRGNHYDYFVDLLVDMNERPAFNTRTIDILIRMGYFEEFGSSGKLLTIMNAFNEGEICYKKTYVEKTKLRRLDQLHTFESSCEESQIPMGEQVRFEIEHFGSPISVYPESRMAMAVIAVDEKYSPKIHLYNLSKGTVGVMKIRKNLFTKNPLKVGDVVKLTEYDKRPARKFVGGKSVVNPGVYDLWITGYEIS